MKLVPDEDGDLFLDEPGFTLVAGDASKTFHLAPESQYCATDAVLCGSVSRNGDGPRVMDGASSEFYSDAKLCRRCVREAEGT